MTEAVSQPHPITADEKSRTHLASRIEVTWNDERRFLPHGQTITAALDRLAIGDWVFMVELNGELIRRECFGEETIEAGDIIELIHMPHGG